MMLDNFHPRWPTGSDGKTEPTFSSQTSQRLDGTTSQTEVSATRQALDTVNTTLNTFITTICTRKSMKNQDRKEAKKLQAMANSCQSVSFLLEQTNEKTIAEIIKATLFKFLYASLLLRGFAIE